MQDIYPDYAEAVDFYAIGVHPGIVEDITVLEAYRREQGHPWPVTTADPQVMAELGVTIQSTKIAFDSQGDNHLSGRYGARRRCRVAPDFYGVGSLPLRRPKIGTSRRICRTTARTIGDSSV